MKTKKHCIIAILMALFFIVSGQTGLWARGSDVGEEGPVPTDPKAQGTKVSGSMTIHYVLDDPENIAGPATMHFFMNLRIKKDVYLFAGKANTDSFVGGFSTDQFGAIMEFIGDTVIPALYPEGTLWALKNVDDWLEPDINGYPDQFICCSDPDGNLIWFTMIDLVLAVQD